MYTCTVCKHYTRTMFNPIKLLHEWALYHYQQKIKPQVQHLTTQH